MVKLKNLNINEKNLTRGFTFAIELEDDKPKSKCKNMRKKIYVKKTVSRINSRTKPKVESKSS